MTQERGKYDRIGGEIRSRTPESVKSEEGGERDYFRSDWGGENKKEKRENSWRGGLKGRRDHLREEKEGNWGN